MNILLCCGAGMSSGFLAAAARKYATKNKLDIEIEATSRIEVKEQLNTQSFDILMIGPHYSADLESFKEITRPYNIPAVIIPSSIYSNLDGENLVIYARKVIEKYNSLKQ